MIKIIFRVFWGIAILVFGLWIVVGEQITGVSANAYINTKIVTLRSPIAGDLRKILRHLRSLLSPCSRQYSTQLKIRQPILPAISRDTHQSWPELPCSGSTIKELD